MLYAVCALSATQLAILIVVIAVAVLIIIENIVLGYFRHKNTMRTLCTQQLQQKRNELLAHLEEVKFLGKASDDEENEEEVEEDSDSVSDDEDEDEDGEEDEAPVSAFASVGDNGASDYEVLAVKDMSSEMCLKYGLDYEENKDKRFYVRYTYGFDAKLNVAEPEVRQRYVAFANDVAQYKGVKIKNSFRGQRICKGQKTLGQIFFMGKTLCVAFALDPANYAETKYRGIDKSGTKRFMNTPMLMKLTSERKLEYAKYLFVQVADANTILLSETPVDMEFDFTPKSRDELFRMNSLRIQFLGEVPDSKSKDEESEI